MVTEGKCATNYYIQFCRMKIEELEGHEYLSHVALVKCFPFAPLALRGGIPFVERIFADRVK